MTANTNEWIGAYAVVTREGDTKIGWGPFASREAAKKWAEDNAPGSDMILIRLMPERGRE